MASLLVLVLGLELLEHWTPTRPPPAAAILTAGAAALVFAIHPVSGITVNYVSARDLQLMQGFFLAMLLAYARMRRLGESPLRWTVVLGCLTLSLLAKPNLVVGPLVLVIFDLVLAGDRVADRRLWLRAGAAAAVVLAFFGWTRIVVGFSDLAQVLQEGSVWSYALTQARRCTRSTTCRISGGLSRSASCPTWSPRTRRSSLSFWSA